MFFFFLTSCGRVKLGALPIERVNNITYQDSLLFSFSFSFFSFFNSDESSNSEYLLWKTPKNVNQLSYKTLNLSQDSQQHMELIPKLELYLTIHFTSKILFFIPNRIHGITLFTNI